MTLVRWRGEPQLVFDRLCEGGWPHTVVEVAREGFRRTRLMRIRWSRCLVNSARYEIRAMNSPPRR